MSEYACARNIFRNTSEIILPANAISVSDAAKNYLRVSRLGSSAAAWDETVAPYMIEPMNNISSRRYDAVVFIGPARTSKTFSLILGGLTYIITSNPGDTLIVQMTEKNARDFSKDDLS